MIIKIAKVLYKQACLLFANREQRTTFVNMKSHNGMRPQDVVVLIKIIISKQDQWQYRDLASDLFLSVSEISESLSRSHIAGLVDDSKRRVFQQSFMEFLEHGLRYVFPQQPGTMVVGVPTAHSQAFFKRKFPAELEYVWPYLDGQARGLAISPLYAGVPKAALKDEQLHKLLASIDILRVGRAREKKIALEELRKSIL